MIYTVTFNPSLDYIVRLDQFTAGEINRVSYEQVVHDWPAVQDLIMRAVAQGKHRAV